jgi:beta-glucosidase/6-phospho-beta-glucosidase/beta-galactosidase
MIRNGEPMDDWRRWHSIRSGVYHSDIRCRTGNNIEAEFLMPGRGGRRQCRECQRLSGDDSAGEGLDLSGLTFDKTLPDGTIRRFLWGVATAGQQVEGEIDNNEWATYCTSPFQQIRVAELGDAGGTRMLLAPAGDALGHWRRDAFEADLDRAQALGLTAYRLSVEWSRVEPTPPAWVTDWIDARRGLSTSDIAFDPAVPGGPAAIDTRALERYRVMVEAIRARGMEPIVTLNHMTLPDWVLRTPATAFADNPDAYDEQTVAGSTLPFTVIMRGSVEDAQFRATLRGWETQATAAAFVQYVRAVVTILGDVRWWLTFNEPIATMISSSYLAGAWPPGFVGAGRRALRLYLNLIRAHIDAYDAIHEIMPDAMVGCSQWVAAARTAPQTIAQRIFVGNNEDAKDQWVFFHNHYFLDAVVRGDDVFGVFDGGAPPDIWWKTSPYHERDWAGHLDYVALQYYRSVFIWHDIALAVTCPSAGGRFTVDIKRDTRADGYLRERLSSDLGWTIEPQGLREVITDAHERYGLPVLITENGIGESQDRNRAAFIVAHLQHILGSIKDGADILGYVHWTIADNWEWTFGYLPQARFGLYTVDREAAGRPRYLTTGALCLAASAAASTSAGVRVVGDLLAVLARRFGTIEPDGTRLIRQIRQSHGQWGLVIAGGEAIELVLVPLQPGVWFGMAYQPTELRWTRLTEIGWEATGGGAGRLTFRLPGTAGDSKFTATTVAPSSAVQPQLSGEVIDAAGTRTWTAARRVLPGVFRGRGNPAAPTHLHLVRFEPEAPWRAAAARGFEAWEVCGNVAVDEVAGTVACVLPDGRPFAGTVSGRQLTGTIDGVSPWTGRALPDDIPFA